MNSAISEPTAIATAPRASKPTTRSPPRSPNNRSNGISSPNPTTPAAIAFNRNSGPIVGNLVIIGAEVLL